MFVLQQEYNENMNNIEQVYQRWLSLAKDDPDLIKELSGNKDFPFIDAGISNAKVWQFYRKVNEAKQQFAGDSDNNFYIDTIGAGMHTNLEPVGNVDADHYDSASEVLLGHLFAESFEQFLMQPEQE